MPMRSLLKDHHLIFVPLQELVQLVIKMLNEFESSEEFNSRRKASNPPPCSNLEALKIQPGDERETVQRKQGED